jgi:hypothetical protein
MHARGAITAALAVALLAAAPAAAEWVDWIAEADLAFEYDDNLNRSAFDDDEEDDFRWLPAARLGRVYQLADLTRLSAYVEVESALHHQFERLNHVSTSGTLALNHKFGIGEVPELRLHFTGGYLNLREDGRDSAFYESGFQLSKHLTPRLDVALVGLWSRRDGRVGKLAVPGKGRDVWDQGRFAIGADAGFLLFDPLLLQVGYRYTDGDFDSACTGANVGKALAREGSNLKAIVLDPVFGGCVYRIDGHAHTASVNLNYGIGSRFSVDLGYQLQWGKGRELIYRSNVASLAVMFRY